MSGLLPAFTPFSKYSSSLVWVLDSFLDHSCSFRRVFYTMQVSLDTGPPWTRAEQSPVVSSHQLLPPTHCGYWADSFLPLLEGSILCRAPGSRLHPFPPAFLVGIPFSLARRWPLVCEDKGQKQPQRALYSLWVWWRQLSGRCLPWISPALLQSVGDI